LNSITSLRTAWQNCAIVSSRKDRWLDHFRIRRARVVGRTAIGRATVNVLRINDVQAMAFREGLLASGGWPPT
jgi:hypothetical protein